MNRNQIKSIVIKGVSQYSNIPEHKIKEDHSLIKDLGFDSMDATELIMHLEETFNIDVPDSDADDLRTVRKVIDYIYKKNVSAYLKKIQKK